MNRFHEVTAELERALSGISFEKLDISDEVKEQVFLLRNLTFLLITATLYSVIFSSIVQLWVDLKLSLLLSDGITM